MEVISYENIRKKLHRNYTTAMCVQNKTETNLKQMN